MIRIAWLTDIHLNFLEPPEIYRFCESVAEAAPDAVVITGDIGEAHDVHVHLCRVAAAVARPIYFVLGNHDFYQGGIAAVRQLALELSQSNPWLRWLPAAGIVPLTENTALIGHDGWGDGRLGNGRRSPIMLNDFLLIDELRSNFDRLFNYLGELGDEAAAHFHRILPDAVKQHRRILVATHPPPFRKACWHEGRLSDDDWLPHFTCKAVGQVLDEFMQTHPDRDMTVLCGHTHSAGVSRILPNLLVKTGGAVYGQPAIQEILAID